MDAVRLGLIGAGGMANGVHYPSLADMPDVEMAALCDLDEGKLGATADRFGIDSRYTDHREMLGKEILDAVYVLMPPHQLFEPAMDGMERGLHLFIEKPPAVTSDQTRQLAAAADRNRVSTMVAFNRRYNPLLNRVRDAVLERGPMLQCTSTFYKNYLDQPPYYRGAIDILSCDAVHAVDMLRWMGGEPDDVASDVRSFKASYDNMFNALIRFEGGAVGVLLTNWNVGARRHTFEMHAEGISAFCDPDGRAEIFADNVAEPEVITAQDVAGSDEMRVFNGFAAENRHFIDCIASGEAPETNLGDALKTMELVDKIYAEAW